MSKKDTNVIKALAIILVYVHHLFYEVSDIKQMTIVYGLLAPDYTALNIWAFLAKVGVSVFVFLTGYGTAKSEKEKGAECVAVMASAAMNRYVKLLLSFQFVFILFMIPTFVKGNWNSIYDGDSLLADVFYCAIDFFGLANVASTATYNGTWWYMSLALMLIAVLPFLIYLCRRYGFLLLILEFFLIRFLKVDFTFAWYMLPAVTGVYFAEKGYYGKLKDLFSAGSVPKKVSVIVLLLFGLCVFLNLRLFIESELWDVIETVLVIMFCGFTCLTISKVPVLGTVLEFVGKHSLNMFLTHTFICNFWFREHIYAFRYPALIVLMLLFETVVISVVIEQIKKWIRFERFAALVCEKCMMLF